MSDRPIASTMARPVQWVTSPGGSEQVRATTVATAESGEAEDIAKADAEDRSAPIRERRKPKRKPLPEHLPRQEVIHEPGDYGACTCPDCGGMAKLGEDVTEVLDYVLGYF